MLACLICDPTDIKYYCRGLVLHVEKRHRLSYKEYYWKHILGLHSEPVCYSQGCSSPVGFRSTRGFAKYCSHSCTMKQTHKDPIFAANRDKNSSKIFKYLHTTQEFRNITYPRRDKAKLEYFHSDIGQKMVRDKWKKIQKELTEFRNTHENMTWIEWVLWTNPEFQKLNPKAQDYRYSNRGFISDFLIEDKKVIIELDGWSHTDPKRDRARDEWLRQKGWAVLRIKNKAIETNVEWTVDFIVRYVGAIV